jgi:hypothetical protein
MENNLNEEVEETSPVTLEAGEEQVEEVKDIPLGIRDIKALKRNKYDDVKNNFNQVFVLKHKTGKIAQLQAASDAHACTLIGWRPRQCKLITSYVKSADEEVDVQTIDPLFTQGFKEEPAVSPAASIS